MDGWMDEKMMMTHESQGIRERDCSLVPQRFVLAEVEEQKTLRRRTTQEITQGRSSGITDPIPAQIEVFEFRMLPCVQDPEQSFQSFVGDSILTQIQTEERTEETLVTPRHDFDRTILQATVLQDEFLECGAFQPTVRKEISQSIVTEIQPPDAVLGLFQMSTHQALHARRLKVRQTTRDCDERICLTVREEPSRGLHVLLCHRAEMGKGSWFGDGRCLFSFLRRDSIVEDGEGMDGWMDGKMHSFIQPNTERRR